MIRHAVYRQQLHGLGECADPITCGLQAAGSLPLTVINLLKSQAANNRNKVIATEDANSYSRAVYGLMPDCAQPTPGIPVTPNATDYKFCEASVAGLVERCRLNEAAAYFGYLVNDMQQLSNQFLYFRNWFNVYGIQMVGEMQNTITRAASICPVAGLPPTDGGGTYIPPSSGGGVGIGINMNSTMIFGAVAALALFFVMRR